MKYVFSRNMAAAAVLYGPPERAQGDASSVYTVPLVHPFLIEARFAVQGGHVQPDDAHQAVFQKCQAACLEALVQNRTIFKHPPSLASLETITPNWGCIYKRHGGAVRVEWSPYMVFDTSEVADMSGMSYAQLVLKALRISRSSIQPVFGVKQAAGPVQIEIDWATEEGADSATEELEEVSDIPAVMKTSGDADFRLRNLAHEKALAKERVRAAYRTADALAEEFYQAYDMSDAESAFSEWEGHSEDDGGSGGR